MFYDEMYRVCEEKGTKPTIVCREIGLSTGNISKWKNGTSPTVDVAVRIANHLGVSLSYLCNPSDILEVRYPPELEEWVPVIERIPVERRAMCLDFLRTHMAIPEAPPKYMDKTSA